MASDKRKRVIKWVLTAVAVATVAGVGGMFSLERMGGESPQKLISMIPDDTDVALDRIEHTASADGRTQWRLTAEKARLTAGKGQLLLTRPAVVFFLDDGRKVTLTADRGVLETRSNDIAVDGNVVVSNRDYRLVTETLRYRHVERVLVGDQPVAIDGRWAELTANAMRVDLDAGTAVFNGSVKGWVARDLS